MARSTTFRQEREPFRNEPSLQQKAETITGPFTFLNPTRAHFQHTLPQQPSAKVEEQDVDSESNQGREPKGQLAEDWTAVYRSRDNRKGRHPISYKVAHDGASANYEVPRKSTDPREIASIIGRMIWYYPVWDVSFDVAVIFTWGSVIWVINAFFSFLPFTNPSTEFSTEVLYGGGITAFIGATVFEIGSFLLMAEAVNENRTACFGWAVEQLYHGDTEKGAKFRLHPEKAKCTHHHANSKNFVGKSQEGSTSTNDPEKGIDNTSEGKSWVWFPSWYELKTHYLRDIGFLACLAQLIGATIFWISGFTALPGINNILTPRELQNDYWIPQILGGSGFVVSGILFMLETQSNWYTPAFGTLGYWIGFFNLVGGVGFTLCPIFGLKTAHWSQYQAACSTFWGSWAFLIGSTVQWYESLQKFPVELEKE